VRQPRSCSCLWRRSNPPSIRFLVSGSRNASLRHAAITQTTQTATAIYATSAPMNAVFGCGTNLVLTGADEVCAAKRVGEVIHSRPKRVPVSKQSNFSDFFIIFSLAVFFFGKNQQLKVPDGTCVVFSVSWGGYPRKSQSDARDLQPFSVPLFLYTRCPQD
jgi:hypothetical protein